MQNPWQQMLEEEARSHGPPHPAQVNQAQTEWSAMLFEEASSQQEEETEWDKLLKSVAEDSCILHFQKASILNHVLITQHNVASLHNTTTRTL